MQVIQPGAEFVSTLALRLNHRKLEEDSEASRRERHTTTSESPDMPTADQGQQQSWSGEAEMGSAAHETVGEAPELQRCDSANSLSGGPSQ